MSMMTWADARQKGAEDASGASPRSVTMWSTLLVVVFAAGLIAAVAVTRTSGATQWIAGAAALAAPGLGHVAATRATSGRQVERAS
jgi:hypothetical protein